MTMTEIKVTKTRLHEYFAAFRLVLKICDKFTITNDIIRPVELTNELTTGAHWIRHPLFTLPADIVYESIDDIEDTIRTISNTKGIKNIYIAYDNHGLYVYLGDNRYTLATYKAVIPSQAFLDIAGKVMTNPNRKQYPLKSLIRAKDGLVVNIRDDAMGMVRLSKSCFPFMGVIRGDNITFSGEYIIEPYRDKDAVIISYMKYKYCEAVHAYVFIPMHDNKSSV